MRIEALELIIAFLYYWMTISSSYPWNVGDNWQSPGSDRKWPHYTTPTPRKIIPMIMPTDSSKSDRIQFTGVTKQPIRTDRRVYQDFTFERKNVRPTAQSVISRTQPRPKGQSTTRPQTPSRRIYEQLEEELCGESTNPCVSETNKTISTDTNRSQRVPPTTIPRPPTGTAPRNGASGRTSGATTSTRPAGDIVVFPDGSRPSFIPKTSKYKGASTFCEGGDINYPAEYIAKLLQKNLPEFRNFFGEDVVNEVNISHRIDVTEETALCPSLEQVVFPKEAQNKDNEWRFIINQGQNKQGVRVETCLREGPCMFAEGFPSTYKTSCKQKYIYRKMLALNEVGEPGSDSFKLPSCCSCYIKEDPLRRLGSKMSPAVRISKTQH